jgi:DNA polymerase-4
MERNIVHMDLDTFFVSCERLLNPKFNGIPLIIGGSSDRGVVASCSYEARTFGVHSAMPMRMALRLCPQAKVVKGDMELYSKQSHTVTEIIKSAAPVMEKASIDEFYLDVTGMDKFFGCYKWTGELIERIQKETGLPMSYALSVNKTVAKIGTGEAKPHGKIEISSQMVKPFLNPLSIKKIPMVGQKTFELLSRINVRKIQTLAEMPVPYLQSLIGENGLTLWKKANGIDENPVEQYSERKSISTDETFPQDTMDLAKVKSTFVSMVEKLAYQLRQEGWITSTVTVKIRYSNFDTHTKQSKIPYTSCDHVLITKVNELFERLYERRMRIRLVGINFSGLIRGAYQINLFEDTTHHISLYQAIDKMKNRFGYESIQRCAGLDLNNDKKHKE